MSLDISIGSDNVNVTHNLNKMAMHVPVNNYYTLYDITWNAEENGFKYAKDIKKLLANASTYLLLHQKRLKKYNPPNGWGSWLSLATFTQELLTLTVNHPRNRIRVSK